MKGQTEKRTSRGRKENPRIYRHGTGYKSNPERDLDIPGLRVVELYKDLLAAAFNYPNYHLLKKSSCYHDGVTHELHRVA